MVDFQKISCNFGAPARATAERQDVVELGATDLKRAFGSGKVWESKVMVLFVWQNENPGTNLDFAFFKIVW